ncbi:MAG: hypothetical protein ABI741_06300 [Ferruginibacter sp.]
MKIASRIILIVAIILIGYGYWGAFTRSGNKVYDEMDAYFPFFMLIGGLILFLSFLILVMIMRRKAKKIRS